MRGFVNFESAAQDDVGIELGVRSAQQSFDARDQFFHGERLGDVIIGSGIESLTRSSSSPRAVRMMIGIGLS